MAWLLAGPAQAPCTRARRLLSSMLIKKVSALSFQNISFLIQTTQWYLFKEKKKKDVLVGVVRAWTIKG